MDEEEIADRWMEETLRINKSDLPSTLYRFVSPGDEEDTKTRDRFFSGAEDLLLRNRIWLSSRNAFNDPFDCRPYLRPPRSSDDIRKFWDSLAEKHHIEDSLYPLIGRHLENHEEFLAHVRGSMDSSLDAVGIRSFTSRVDHPLMWAHYASSYSGMAYVFAHAIEGVDFGALPVRYQEKYPSVSSTSTAFLPYQLLVKSIEWAYECEWRLIEPRKAGSLHDIDPRAIRGIVFGPLADISVVNRVIEIVREREKIGLPSVRIYGSDFNEDSFGLVFSELVENRLQKMQGLPIA